MTWKIIKNMIGKNDETYSTKQIDFLIRNQYVSDNSTIANSFNNYLTNIGGALAKQLNLILTL